VALFESFGGIMPSIWEVIGIIWVLFVMIVAFTGFICGY
jgi:hypothetical protein